MPSIPVKKWATIVAMMILMMSCSKEENANISEPEEELQLELTAAETTVVAGSEIIFEVTSNGQPVTDADLYIDGQKENGYQHTFEEVGETTIIARKTGFQDSAPLTITVEEVEEEENTPNEVDIYVLGNEGTEGLNHYRPLYWKNGEPNVFEHEALADMMYNQMAVVNNKVYVAGERIYSSSRAASFYWMDGLHDELTGSDGFASGKKIYVSDAGIFVGGIINESSSVTSVVYWKNAELVTVASGALGMTSGGPIVVKDNDVYIAGVLDGTPTYWKNGEGVPLEGGSGEVTDIAVADNGDVYTAGFSYGGPNVAQYWKNGERITLGTGEWESKANTLFIENNDVYVAGWEKIRRPSGAGTVSVARYWKNGEAVDLSDGTNRAEANGLYVLDGKVYVSGVEFMDRRSATIWVDDETIRLSHEDNNAYAGDIVVVKKNIE